MERSQGLGRLPLGFGIHPLFSASLCLGSILIGVERFEPPLFTISSQAAWLLTAYCRVFPLVFAMFGDFLLFYC